MTTEYGYDAVGNLVRQANENVTLTYRYDLNNRMTEEARTEGGTTLRSGFAYDKAGQLTSFRRSDGYAEAYTYDPVGNMVEKVLNGTKIAMTYDAANELKTMESSQGKLTYAYDLNGNLTQKTLGDRTDTYSYDARNRLKQYRGYDNYQVKYSYSALGMLHARESSGAHSRTTLEELIAGKEDSDDPDGDGDGPRTTTYVYDLTQPYYEVLTETTDGEVTSYTYGLERLAAYTDETRTAYLYDGRGSVIQTIGSLGTQTMAYSAYGELLTGKVSGYGYNGEYYDAATGMLNLRARQYEPAQGRFSQRDSLKGWATSPRSLNAYLYCQNDAINYFDASGAAMVAVNMTDGGGGRTSSTSASPSSLFQKAGQTIKSVVSTVASAAAVAKAVNDQALKKGLVNSILKESRDPVAQLQRVRENRAQAQATTPTVVGHSFLRSVKKFACMTQEEYDAGDEVYGSQLSSSTQSPTPQPTPKPTPQPGPAPSPTPPSAITSESGSRSIWKDLGDMWFGAESRITHQTEISSKTIFNAAFGDNMIADWFNFWSPVNIEVGAGERFVLSSSGDSSKTFSYYLEQRVDDLQQSTSGLVANSPWLSTELRSGLSDTGVYILKEIDGTEHSIGVSIDWTNLKIALEYVTTTDMGDGYQFYSYSKVSGNFMSIAYAYFFLQTGDFSALQNMLKQQKHQNIIYEPKTATASGH